MTSIIAQFYDAGSEIEWGRLERHRIEYAITMRALARYLPAAPARVLDIGGSVGRYSIALTQRGYAVTLVDISAGCLDFARAKADEMGAALEAIIRADGRDLHMLGDATFDAVLLMGPLYHLLTHEDRAQAVREAARVLKPGGVVVAAFINRYAGISYAATERPTYIVERPENVTSMLTRGLNLQPAGATSGFPDSWFAHPTEVAPLMAEGGFRQTTLLNCEPLVNGMEAGINSTEGALWEQWVDVLYGIADDPYLLAAAGHLLYVGVRDSDDGVRDSGFGDRGAQGGGDRG